MTDVRRADLRAGTKMTPASESASDADNIWEVARRLGLYGLSRAELDAVIHRRHCSPERADRIAAEAARYVRGLRIRHAAGDVC